MYTLLSPLVLSNLSVSNPLFLIQEGETERQREREREKPLSINAHKQTQTHAHTPTRTHISALFNWTLERRAVESGCC